MTARRRPRIWRTSCRSRFLEAMRNGVVTSYSTAERKRKPPLNSPALNAFRFRQQGFARRLHLFQRDGQNTPRLVESIAAISGARIAREVILHHAMRSLPWAPVHRAAGAENGDDWPSRSSSDVRRSAIVADKNSRAGCKRNQFAQIERIEQREVATAFLPQFAGDFLFPVSRSKHRRNLVCLLQPAREPHEFFRRPTLGEIFSARVNYSVRIAARNSRSSELFRDRFTGISLGINFRWRNWPARQSCCVKLLDAVLDGMNFVAGIRHEHVIEE